MKISKVIDELNNLLTDLSAIEGEVFTYREKVLIERHLYIIVNEFIDDQEKNNVVFTFNQDILKYAKDSADEIILGTILEIKAIISMVTHDNAYVRYDALSNYGIQKHDVAKLLLKKIAKIMDATRLIAKNGVIDPLASLQIDPLKLSGQM